MEKIENLKNKNFSSIMGKYADMSVEEDAYRSYLIYGQAKAGKTYLLDTFPAPILVAQFDPQGPLTLYDKGTDMSRIRFMNFVDNPTDRTSGFQRFYNFLKKEQEIFDFVNTFVVDSLTMMIDSVEKYVVGKRSGSSGEVGDTNLADYKKIQALVLQDVLPTMLNLPCNVVCTGHVEMTQDTETGKVIMSLSTLGKKLPASIPCRFSEFYYLSTKKVGTKLERILLTDVDGRVQAGSRLAATGKLQREEEPNIKKILQKCGKPYEDTGTWE